MQAGPRKGGKGPGVRASVGSCDQSSRSPAKLTTPGQRAVRSVGPRATTDNPATCWAKPWLVRCRFGSCSDRIMGSGRELIDLQARPRPLEKFDREHGRRIQGSEQRDRHVAGTGPCRAADGGLVASTQSQMRWCWWVSTTGKAAQRFPRRSRQATMASPDQRSTNSSSSQSAGSTRWSRGLQFFAVGDRLGPVRRNRVRPWPSTGNQNPSAGAAREAKRQVKRASLGSGGAPAAG